MVQRILSYMLIAVAPLGCATISRGEASTDDKILRIERSVQPSGFVNAELEQSESVIHLRATQKCDLVEVRKIHRTTRYPKKNEEAGPEIALFAVGLIPAGIGAGLIADSKNVYPSDRQSRLYNASGPGGAIGGGIALVGLGVALAAVPVVDLFRSVGSEVEETDVSENGSAIQQDVPCSNPQPIAYNNVALAGPGVAISLGNTDANGLLNVDAADMLPAELTDGRNLPSSVNLLVGGRPAGRVRLGPILEKRRAKDAVGEDEVWQKLDIGACRTERNPTACQMVRSFLMRFPNGVHSAEALRILDPSAGGGVQIAASPEDIAKAEAAQKAAAEALEKAKKAAADEREKAQKKAAEEAEKQKKAAAAACKKTCEAGCKKEPACTKSCMEEACQ